MSEKKKLSIRWSEYQPTKKIWIWSTIGSSVLTMALGFGAAGWMPAGRASVMAEIAARNASARLAAEICVQRFISSSDATSNLSALKAIANWDRKKFMKDGGWMAIAGVETVPGATGRCVDQLVEMKTIPQPDARSSDT
ncbi:hypothetical protein [Rhizobium sp. Root483D2]|uniref:hypothetical protein n=1 Tax=Rhizobium sp. Root483D2 TaxID=1736545 RepID=UPI000713BE2B|nr:hypothetical protein [Rhizobium sp. Root483D2]KQY27838.1 hypothetical protein ASD32_24815 [Rhizobium sp. Root483D2]